jgi:DNA polymerase-3 subunit gamma/tau
MKALALKYRPETFDDVVEQKAIRQILQEQVATKTHKHAYLFTGGAGTGKTTCARILANEINAGKGKPIEIDAASNNGVDDVREIINDAKFKALDSEYKVYILDECHMFSTGAWNAMLKLIEEPPAKTIFIFCTTDPQKIPATILSRVQRYDFQRITYHGILNRLIYIMEDGEGRQYERAALEYIAKLAEGGMRDAITMLDKCLSFSKDVLTLKDVVEALGTVDYDTMFEILGFLLARKTVLLLAKIDAIHKLGADLKQFMKQFGWFVLDVCKYQKLGNFEYLQIPEIYERQMEQLMEFQESNLLEILHKVLEVNNLIKWETNAKALIEASFILHCEGVGG